MIVRCVNNRQEDAPRVFENGYRHPTYVFGGLTVGSEYIVMGMLIFQDDLAYLVRTKVGDARWCAPYFFKVVDDRIPPYWQFRYNIIEGESRIERIGVRAVWGYRELVEDPLHNAYLQSSEETDTAKSTTVSCWREFSQSPALRTCSGLSRRRN